MDTSAVQRGAQPLAAVAEAAVPVETSAQNRDVIQAVKAINATEMFGQENELTYQMDRSTHRIIVRVVNRNTKEVVSQIPPEYVLRLHEELNAQRNK